MPSRTSTGWPQASRPTGRWWPAGQKFAQYAQALAESQLAVTRLQQEADRLHAEAMATMASLPGPQRHTFYAEDTEYGYRELWRQYDDVIDRLGHETVSLNAWLEIESKHVHTVIKGP